jgi:hypothetical protein
VGVIADNMAGDQPLYGLEVGTAPCGAIWLRLNISCGGAIPLPMGLPMAIWGVQDMYGDIGSSEYSQGHGLVLED